MSLGAKNRIKEGGVKRQATKTHIKKKNKRYLGLQDKLNQNQLLRKNSPNQV